MSEPQQNQDEALREFESAANKTAIARQHAMEAAERTCLGLRIEIQQWKQRAEKAEAELAGIKGTPWEQDRKKLVDFLKFNWPYLRSVDAWPADRAIGALMLLVREREKAEAERDAEKLRADKAEAELAKRFPDIGPDPLKLDGDEWKKRGDIPKVLEVLNKAISIQQSGVPDQTALVWRIDLSRLMDDHTVLASRWRRLKPALESAEAELKSAAQREDALRRELIGHREKAQGNYWAWQGDNDHLETLVTHCPVLIQAKDLQEIISKRDKAYAEMRKYLELARHKFIQTHASNLDQLQTMPTPYDHALSTDCGRGHIPASELDETIEYLRMEAAGKRCDAIGYAKGKAILTRLESLRKEPVEPISGEEFREWLKKMDAKKESLRKDK